MVSRKSLRKAYIQGPVFQFSIESNKRSNDHKAHARWSEDVDRRARNKGQRMFIQTYICGPNWSRLHYPHNRGRSLIIMYNIGQTSQRAEPTAGQIPSCHLTKLLGVSARRDTDVWHLASTPSPRRLPTPRKLHIKCGEEAICKASWRGRRSLGCFLGDWRLVAGHFS